MHRFKVFILPSLLLLLFLTPGAMSAQTNQTEAQRWLAKAELAPAFAAPVSKAAWEQDRVKIRAQLWDLLGKLPPRRGQEGVNPAESYICGRVSALTIDANRFHISLNPVRVFSLFRG